MHDHGFSNLAAGEALRGGRRAPIIGAMLANQWQRRIERAEELAKSRGSAAEILGFYRAVLVYQLELYRELLGARWAAAAARNPFAEPLVTETGRRFGGFLKMVEESGPAKLAAAAAQVGASGHDAQGELLGAFWEGKAGVQGTDDFLARAYLQPLAALLREKASMRWSGPVPYVCPHCGRKPSGGVLRPLGEGGQRSLICSFCLGEWKFRRMVCAACGEETPDKLAVYTAEELPHVRVEACESCKSYIKTVDLTKSGLGEPVVDEIASVALDLWAQGRGYAKLQVNLMQM